jgi:hypothetical protein
MRTKSEWRRRAFAAMFSLLLLPPFFLTAGCRKAASSPEGRLAIENVAKWRVLYCADHNGAPPADEQTFVAFIKKKLAERGEAMNDTMLVSPRDGQKYLVQYGKPSAKLGDNSVTVHEQQGSGGKLLVAFGSGRSSEVDATQLPLLLSAK